MAAVAGLLSSGCGGGQAHRPPTRALAGGPSLGSLAQSGAGRRFYEIYEPTGRPRGTVLVLHGGGWRAARADARRQMAAVSLSFRDLGWRVVDANYAGGPRPDGSVDPRPMLRDVVAYYDEIHRAFPGPVCTYGESAGGHLAALLAIERPTLTCAVLAAAPLDLPSLLPTSTPAGSAAIRAAFGTSPATLRAWSPTRLWGSGRRVRVFATAASNDPVVGAGQLRSFAQRVPTADVAVLPGARAGTADAVPWIHSPVRRGALDRRVADLRAWLTQSGSDPAVPGSATDPGTDCGPGSTDVGAARWRLLRAGDGWSPTSTATAPIVATRGCSGSAVWQDDGLSLWAYPGLAVLRSGSEAALTLRLPRGTRSLTAMFRGFLARPRDWAVGLYGSSRTHGTVTAPIADCMASSCHGLRLVRRRGGSLVAALASTGNPDARSTPTPERFRLPPDTRRVAWRLRCIAPGGCSLQGAVDARGFSLRRRDPLGHPAILSIYRVELIG
ncbi:alpha/beta hydrolase fold domain-containing protein [Paraconexibacter antarcticus]|uniref:Alpha/beta hydrolase fold domain-containing protein n=1 Tax=Paraconexibacter antarcticus TaxID=2949664 RepID=A0ABY5DPS2_9ACTN|nr:alpha/beta hydrolase fold domain-containing protein [Paraconexibacter antarcticus]UTI62604.1 alpha/beta hydrolase fold domain-containing protein [Paraconexibacter antarcticus]